MSKKALYTSIKTTLEELKTSSVLKHVALWNNQIERENVENAFLYPAAFIEFVPSDYTDLSKGVQQVSLTVRIHVCFESYKDEDIDLLDLADQVFQKLHFKQYDYFTKLLRRNEEQNFDHNNVQDYMIDFSTMGNDYGGDDRATLEHTATQDLTVNIA